MIQFPKMFSVRYLRPGAALRKIQLESMRFSSRVHLTLKWNTFSFAPQYHLYVCIVKFQTSRNSASNNILL